MAEATEPVSTPLRWATSAGNATAACCSRALASSACPEAAVEGDVGWGDVGAVDDSTCVAGLSAALCDVSSGASMWGESILGEDSSVCCGAGGARGSRDWGTVPGSTSLASKFRSPMSLASAWEGSPSSAIGAISGSGGALCSSGRSSSLINSHSWLPSTSFSWSQM